MKFDKSKIDEELRTKGEVIRFILPYYTKTKMKIVDKFSALIFKGKKPSDSEVNYNQAYISRGDDSKFRVCVYYSNNTMTAINQGKKAIAVLWVHGGGYAMSEPEQDYVFFKKFVKNYNVIVFAPDYTKSLEKPFPAAFEDVKLAYEYIKNNAEKFGLFEDNIFVGGDSAGGGLSLSLALYARDVGDNSIAFCMPIYPMINHKHTESSKDNEMPVWNTKSNDNAWKIYLEGANKASEEFKYASPAIETNYSELPSMLTYVGTEDPFYIETKTLVKNLKKAGVKVEFKEFGGCYHGFDVACPKAKKSIEAKEFLLQGFDKAYDKTMKKLLADNQNIKQL